MTDLSRESVKRISELARLELADEEISNYQKELVKILNAFEALSKVPLAKDLQGDARSGIAVHKAAGGGESVSRMRPDVADNSIQNADFVAQAPDREGVFVRVPAILERST